MHFPAAVTIKGNIIPVHTICEWVGMFIAFRYYKWLKRRQGDVVEPTTRLAVLTAAIFGAVFGSHIIGALENLPQWLAWPHFWDYLYGNKTLVGGVLGALLFVEVVKKLMGETANTGDLFTFPLMLGMIIGRMGCFSMGVYEETYGLPSRLPWAMDLGDGIPRHPVALYEIVFLIALWAVLAMVRRRYSVAQGGIFKLFMIAYLSFRFLLDFIKPGWRYALGLGTIQLTCLAGLIYYSRYIVHPRSFIKAYAC